MRREQEQIESPPDINGMTKVMEDSTAELIEELVGNAVSGIDLLNNEKDIVVSYLLAVLMYGNSQRPSAVTIITMAEYKKRKPYTEGGQNYTVLKVSKL